MILIFIVFRLRISLLVANFILLSHSRILNTILIFSILLFDRSQRNIIILLIIFFEIILILKVFINNIDFPIKSIRTLILRMNVFALNFLFSRYDSGLNNLINHLLSPLPCLYQISMFFRRAQTLLLIFWTAFSIFYLTLRVNNLVVNCLLFDYEITEVNKFVMLVFLNRSCIYCLSIVLVDYILYKSLLLSVEIFINELLCKLLVVCIAVDINLLDDYPFVLNVVS